MYGTIWYRSVNYYHIILLLQYASVNELEKWRKDHLKAVSTLKELLDTAETKLNAPVLVSFLNVRAFLQDVEVRKAQPREHFCMLLAVIISGC